MFPDLHELSSGELFQLEWIRIPKKKTWAFENRIKLEENYELGKKYVVLARAYEVLLSCAKRLWNNHPSRCRISETALVNRDEFRMNLGLSEIRQYSN